LSWLKTRQNGTKGAKTARHVAGRSIFSMHKNAIGGLDYDTKERMEDAEEEFRILDLRIQSTMENDPTHWIEQQARSIC
jgi:hypothetical protein